MFKKPETPEELAQFLRSRGAHDMSVQAFLASGHDLDWLMNASIREIMAIRGIGGHRARDLLRAVGREGELGGFTAIPHSPKSVKRVMEVRQKDKEGMMKIDSSDIEQEIAEERKRLGERFEVITPNDEANLDTLAALVVYRRHVLDMMSRALSDGDYVELDALQKQNAKLCKDILALEKALEIDVPTRRKAREATRADEVIEELIKATKRFRAQHIKHCQHCGVLLGFICVHFPAHFPRTIKVTCPRCLEEFEWEIVSDEDLALYVEAQDFLPEGAPPELVRSKDASKGAKVSNAG